MRIGFAFALSMIATGCVSSYQPAPGDVGVPIALTDAQQMSVQNGVRSVMKDPNSAIFGPLYAARTASGKYTVCGTVNGRNSFGGYTGAQAFIGIGGQITPTYFTFSPVTFGSDEGHLYAVATLCKAHGVVW